MLTYPKNMTKVSREQFFKIMGPRNVTPRAIGEYDQYLGFQNEWVANGWSKQIDGISEGGTLFANSIYMVRSALIP